MTVLATMPSMSDRSRGLIQCARRGKSEQLDYGDPPLKCLNRSCMRNTFARDTAAAEFQPRL